MKKKAVSPLIATVLLIGFTVAIGVFVYLWYGSFIKEQTEKQGALSEIKTACASEIEISVSSVCKSSSGLKLNVKNEKSNIIHGIRARITGDVGTELKTEKESFGPLEEKQLEVNYDIDKVGSVLKFAEVMPLIVRQGVAGTCSEQLVKYDLSGLSDCKV